MYDELTEVDIKKMQEEIDYRTRVLRPQLIEDFVDYDSLKQIAEVIQ